MNALKKEFLENYYKAAETSRPEDWFQAALSAKRMYNGIRVLDDEAIESKISADARLVYGGH